GLVLGAGLFGDSVGRGFEAAALRPFLERGLGVGPQGYGVADAVAQHALEELVGASQAAVAVDGADDRFGGVGEDAVVAGAADAALALAEVQFGADVELAGDGGAAFGPYQGHLRPVELALAGLGQAAVEHVGD